MAFISLFHRNLKKGYIHKNVNIITLIIDDFIVLFNFRILKSKGYFRPFTKFIFGDSYRQRCGNVFRRCFKTVVSEALNQFVY